MVVEAAGAEPGRLAFCCTRCRNNLVKSVEVELELEEQNSGWRTRFVPLTQFHYKLEIDNDLDNHI